MTVRVATKTLALIDQMIEADQGAAFRQLLEPIIPKMEDAYRGSGAPFRKHLGVSLIGKECARDLFYGFRWAKAPHFEGQTLRLFNRGHLEEARFLAMLQMIKCNIWYETETGGQFRVSFFNGHMGSALDGVANNIPDLGPEDLAYTEFKTASNKNFNKMKKNGLMETKMQHFAQMQVCMKKFQLPFGLYLVVNKDTDELYGEIITADEPVADSYVDRGENIIFTDEPPLRISKSKAFYKCRFCDYKMLCHDFEKPAVNCRTCVHATAERDGSWSCARGGNAFINGEYAMQGCTEHVYNPNLLNGVTILGGDFAENYVEIKLPNGDVIKHGPNHITGADLCLGKREPE